MNKFLKFLLVCQSLNLLADNLLTPIFAIFVLNLGGNPQLIGVLWGLQHASSAIVGFFILRLHDKRNLNFKLLIRGNLFKGLAWTFLAFNQTIPALIIVQIIIGASHAIGGPSFYSMISEHMDKNKHIKDWGTIQLISNLVIAVSSIISGIMIASYGFTAILIIMALLQYSSLYIIMLNKPKNHKH
ncbi:MAG: MFS transporter [bacterium]|nr:MFS transporter [bacterium]